MRLGQLIWWLSRTDPNYVPLVGFTFPHSYRGYYEQLAFEPACGVTVASMLRCAGDSVGLTFGGYHGGEYVMDATTPVWLARYGDEGMQIGVVLLWYMLHDGMALAISKELLLAEIDR